VNRTGDVENGSTKSLLSYTTVPDPVLRQILDQATRSLIYAASSTLVFPFDFLCRFSFPELVTSLLTTTLVGLAFSGLLFGSIAFIRSGFKRKESPRLSRQASWIAAAAILLSMTVILWAMRPQLR